MDRRAGKRGTGGQVKCSACGKTLWRRAGLLTRAVHFCSNTCKAVFRTGKPGYGMSQATKHNFMRRNSPHR